ncbi:MAG: hypothetical protein IAI48_07855, partial [Candidatus Eremiobacteraeota bacterium]|nr:hypothetical protein [Candidatus Eremiobacteraeota bacterium]
AYPRAIAAVSAIFPASGEPGGAIVPRLTTICALVLVALALIVRRTGWPGTWEFVSLGSIPFPWYLAWGLPYAVLDPERALPYLVTFPFAAFVMTTTFPATGAWPPVAIGLPVVAALLAYGRFRGRRSALARPFALAARRASVL